ncbi:P47 [Buzura suppressaria nucleopolyhedrovirus]|uniref:p47 n=1 Tax=Buzura suppressaria nuclear polyhedrosis virus TaxID=74320 RepID=W5VKZ5_NPVBS|nr:P47 [Buzura suppressaria nucleopolyhedrovirus]AHH82614.1 P47 [Buzura suppressaria nucleopolyhedrovirus]AKN90995.1 P47 [Buzura suppressaria nucleopolyhedrovirus]QYF10539.1 subunit of the baculovirus polymerase [Buzura suppressaria nucleopolyhedrovirus]
MAFARYVETRTQWLPQCCKYLSEPINMYNMYLNGVSNSFHVMEHNVSVNDEGFVQLYYLNVVFDMENLRNSTPVEIEHYIDATRKTMLTDHEIKLLKLLARDRWHKGDFVRLRKILTRRDVKALVGFACNTMWERGYENHYTLGQQLSVRITTKLIQSGLDFKHHTGREDESTPTRGWDSVHFEKFINSIGSISDVIKRHQCNRKYIVLELLPANCNLLKQYLQEQQLTLIHNKQFDNLCAIEIDTDKSSLMYLIKFTALLRDKIVNVLFVTDLEFYLKQNNYLFYLYNSLKLYYYCLTNKFVFEKQNYEIIFLLNLIVSLEWHNGGHLNSFTLEKSSIYNPLELSTRRLNSIKRAANQCRTLNNDNEIKIDFIKGKRIKTGTHYGHRLVVID